MNLSLRVREVDVFLRHIRTRMSFRYGKAEVTGQPYAHLRVRFESGAGGVSAAALPPLWFDKRPGLTHEQTIRDLLRSIALASEVYRNAPAANACELHRTCEPEARRRCVAEGMNDLTAGFGVALMDAAVIDAACRNSGRTFHQGLREDLFGLGSEFAKIVPEKPLGAILVRHTVGMSDPITASDVTAPVKDGLPETLEEVIRAYHVEWFKVKISSDVGSSLDRLRRIAAILDRDVDDYGMTLDGNEQFHSMEDVLEFARRLQEEPSLRRLLLKTAWIEQPVQREIALADSIAAPLAKVAEIKPVLVDESDGTDEAVDRALDLGYIGISAKNCKGVFRTLHSFRATRRRAAFLSSEDLMNIPVVPLHQDLCVAAALGIPHSERNGHHYIRAFEYFSPREHDAAIREYPELYSAGRPVPRIEEGFMNVSGINAFGFGVRSEPDWDFLERA